MAKRLDRSFGYFFSKNNALNVMPATVDQVQAVSYEVSWYTSILNLHDLRVHILIGTVEYLVVMEYQPV